MKRIEPSNECYLSAELSKVVAVPGQAAHIAAELCHIGRSYRRLAERLCGGEAEWGRWSDRVEKAQSRAYNAKGSLLLRARALVAGLPVAIEEHDLHLQCVTTIKRGHPAAQTALQ